MATRMWGSLGSLLCVGLLAIALPGCRVIPSFDCSRSRAFHGFTRWIKERGFCETRPGRRKKESLDGQPAELTAFDPFPTKGGMDWWGGVRVWLQPGTDAARLVEFLWPQRAFLKDDPRQKPIATSRDIGMAKGKPGDLGLRLLTANDKIVAALHQFCRDYLKADPSSLLNGKAWKWQPVIPHPEGRIWKATARHGPYLLSYEFRERTKHVTGEPIEEIIEEELAVGNDDAAFCMFWNNTCSVSIRVAPR